MTVHVQTPAGLATLEMRASRIGRRLEVRGVAAASRTGWVTVVELGRGGGAAGNSIAVRRDQVASIEQVKAHDDPRWPGRPGRR